MFQTSFFNLFFFNHPFVEWYVLRVIVLLHDPLPLEIQFTNSRSWHFPWQFSEFINHCSVNDGMPPWPRCIKRGQNHDTTTTMLHRKGWGSYSGAQCFLTSKHDAFYQSIFSFFQWIFFQLHYGLSTGSLASFKWGRAMGSSAHHCCSAFSLWWTREH